jgi:hypothetical protein
MRTACLLFLTMSWAALIPGTGYAVPASGAETGRASGTIHPHSGVPEPPGSTHPIKHTLVRPTVNRPKPLSTSRQHSQPGNVTNFHPPSSNQTGGPANSGFTRTGTVNTPLAFRAPTVGRSTVPLVSSVHHRSPNPALVVGSPNLHSSNAAAIDGARVNRRH